MSTLSLDLVRDAAGLQALAPEWHALWERVPGATPFQAPAWLLPWWRVFGTAEPIVVCLHDGGRLMGLLPLYILEEGGHRKLLPMGAGNSDYLDALLDPTLPPETLTRMLSVALHSGEAVCDLFDVPPDGTLPQAGFPSGWHGAWQRGEPCPVLPVPTGVASVEAAIPARQRRKLHMNRHRAERAGGWAVSFADPMQMLAPLLDLHARRWPGEDPAVAAFHRAALPQLCAAGLVRMACLRIGGGPAAFCYALADHRHRLMFYMIGFDAEYAAFSPGSLLIAGMIDAALAEDRREIHFLRGDEAYKYAWGAQDRSNLFCRLARA